MEAPVRNSVGILFPRQLLTLDVFISWRQQFGRLRELQMYIGKDGKVRVATLQNMSVIIFGYRRREFGTSNALCNIDALLINMNNAVSMSNLSANKALYLDKIGQLTTIRSYVNLAAALGKAYLGSDKSRCVTMLLSLYQLSLLKRAELFQPFSLEDEVINLFRIDIENALYYHFPPRYCSWYKNHYMKEILASAHECPVGSFSHLHMQFVCNQLFTLHVGYANIAAKLSHL
ncbi:hypothetical protein FF38_14160 [Lucilia cuprina]|uniref:Uncharacterized protein n=1 Tax=Lucilia cuprina TaxID=7375 RepID=A0A0L0BPK2_LUCCU|nr:hypothetical protein FF38_14160 [Lucilia cuprina]